MGLPMIASAMSAAAPIAQGIAGYQEAKGQQEQAKINASIARTRAMQTDTVARQGLNEELATLRSTLGANQQRQNVGTSEIFAELRKVRGRDRRIEFNNEMQAGADYRLAGRNAGTAARGALLGGFAKAGPSLFDMYEQRK